MMRWKRCKNSVVRMSVTLTWRGVMKDCWICVISWRSLHQTRTTRRRSSVLLGPPALRRFCCSWLTTPFLPTRTAEALVWYDYLRFRTWTGWATSHGAGWHLLTYMSNFLLPPTQLLKALVVTWPCLR